MYSTTVVLCTAMVLFHEVSSHLFPQTYLDQVTNIGDSKVYKRQADDDEDMLVQCALDRFNTFYQGNNSNFVSQCRSFFSSEFDLLSGTTSTFRTLCIPDCGNVVIDAFTACGASREETRSAAALCGSNENGNTCYEIFAGTVNLLNSALMCSIGTGCDCSSISEEVTRQGCCIVNYNEIINNLDDEALGQDFDLNDVYDMCNIDVPERECNNSPLSGSSSVHASYISAVAILLALFINNIG